MGVNEKPESLLVVLTDESLRRNLSQSGILGALTARAAFRVVALSCFQSSSEEIFPDNIDEIDFGKWAELESNFNLSISQKILSGVSEWAHKYYTNGSSGNKSVHSGAAELLQNENVGFILHYDATNPLPHSLRVEAKRLNIPVTGYLPSLSNLNESRNIRADYDQYIVQDYIMKDHLVRVLSISEPNVVVTGWPKMDKYINARSAIVDKLKSESFGLAPDKPCVLLACGSDAGHSFIHGIFKDIFEWREINGGPELFSIIIKPGHPESSLVDEYELSGSSGQVRIIKSDEKHFYNFKELMAVASCVVCDGGDIFMESLVSDRPVVALNYSGEGRETLPHFQRSVSGAYYQEISSSGALYVANNFNEVIDGIKKSIANPEELAENRYWLSRLVVGELDGHAASRVANAIEERMLSPKE